MNSNTGQNRGQIRLLQVIFIPALAAGILTAAAGWKPQAARADAGDAASVVERGKYLVTAMSCNDCHTPWKMGANGPEPDMSRMLSGHPADMKMPPPPPPAGPWGISAALTNTAWAGPWGVSFTANLTPDEETGLGKWTEQDFQAAVRSGRHMGRGRPILPPMPYPSVASLNDQDLHAVWSYLRSIPAVRNQVPPPAPPAPAPGR